ncbi:MAG: choice-of-anchor D domain-containing protein [Burkholderiaceae bacterium]
MEIVMRFCMSVLHEDVDAYAYMHSNQIPRSFQANGAWRVDKTGFALKCWPPPIGNYMTTGYDNGIFAIHCAFNGNVNLLTEPSIQRIRDVRMKLELRAMKFLYSLTLALLMTMIWSELANAQSCSNGRTVYRKSTPATGGLSCSSSDCHGLNPGQNKNSIQSGAGNPSQIDAALDGTTNNQSMVALDLRNNLPLMPSDILDLAQYIFLANAQGNCPAGTASVAASTSSINFGSVANGSTSAATLVTVTNSGSASATGLVYSNSASNKWIVSNGTPSCTSTLAAGASCSFSIAYKPAAAGASDSGTYSASTANGFTISLSGSSPTVVSPTPANLQATPASVAFGSVTVGSSSSAQAISIRNLGTAGAVSVTFTNSNSARFAISGQSCGTSLAGGATCGFNLTYAPSAVASDSGSITVGYTGGSVIIGLSGAGTTVAPPPPPPPPSAQTVDVIEYYHAAFGHYFVTYLQAEITALDNGTFAGWARTGKQFKAWTSSATGLTPVCRFFTNYVDFAPKSSHFYTPDVPECAVVQTNKVWQYEGQVFHTQSPSVTGGCPPNTVPVYRMYNNGQSGAPNHRYTTDLSVRAEMIAVTKTPAPWIPEGAGTIGVIMCAPP